MSNNYRLRSTIKYPTSLIVNGASNVGLEVAESLLEQGGYVIIVDAYSDEIVQRIQSRLGSNALVSLLDYSAIPHLEEDLRRLDYVFYLDHEGLGTPESEISTQDFLKYSNYLDTLLSLAVKFEAKFLLTTSIKAHQILMQSQDLDVKFGKNAPKHTVYTDMEAQRYAESLCLEYVSKTGLNARIVRLGEIIGEGMDFSHETGLTTLVLAAVRGDDLVLHGDGLESDWYVHLLDAAYGLIKAQFSKDTESDIYSVAYENSITHLSVAYKIHELEPDAKEIRFIEEDHSIPPLRLHKPAPNLSKLGWTARIDFEQALKESLASAKLLVLQAQAMHKQQTDDDGMAGKIASFLNLAQQSAGTSLDDVDAGPVSRLIAERRRQEQLREAALNKADSSIKKKKGDRGPRSPIQKVQAWVWKTFLDSSTNFPFLRKLTPARFVWYLIGMFLMFGIYFFVVAPTIVLVRNTIVINNAKVELAEQIANYELESAHQNAVRIRTAFQENSDILSSYQGVATLIGAGEYYDDLLLIIQDYGDIAEAAENILYSVEPFSRYLGSYSDNIQFRPNSENYLSVGRSTDYSLYLDELLERRAFADVGLRDMDKAVSSLRNRDISFLPQFLVEPVRQLNTEIGELGSLTGFADLSKFAPEILGSTAPKTYLVLLVDNSKPNPAGGEFSAFMLFTMQNGAIADARVQSVDSFAPGLGSLPGYVVDTINTHRYSDQATSAIQLGDLAYMVDTELFTDTVKDVWGKAFSRQIDALVVMDYELLEHLIPQISVNGVEVESSVFTGTNLLGNLHNLQGSTQTAVRRNDLTAQLFARMVDTMFDRFSDNIFPVMSTFITDAGEKHAYLPTSELGIDESIQTAGFGGDLISNTDLPVSVILVADRQIISPKRYPALNYVAQMELLNDSSLTYTFNLKYPSMDNIDEAGICLPLVAKDLKVSGISSSRVKLKQSAGQSCMIADVTTETELTFSWSTLPIENSEEEQYNISLGQSKLAGTQVISDFEITLAPGLKFLSIHPAVTASGGGVIFTESLRLDQLVEFTVTK